MRLRFLLLLYFTGFALLALARPGGAQAGPCPQIEPYLSIAAINGQPTSGALGQPDQASLTAGGCVALRFIVVRQSGATATVEDVTDDPNTRYFTDPARGSFASGNLFCVTAADCNQGFPIYGVYHDSCSGTDLLDTVHIHVNPCALLLQCPPDIVQAADPGKCTARLQYPTPDVTGNSGTFTLVCSPPSGSDFPVGTTTVTCTATDAAGNSTTCTFKVTVKDTEPPQVQCAADITALATAGQCSASVAVPPPVATDNCPGVTVAGQRSDGKLLTDPYPIGTTTLTWTATDASGNSATCRQRVTVTSAGLSLQCPADITRSNDPGKCSAQVEYSPPVVTGSCGPTTLVCSPLSGSAFPVGTTTVNCTATDAGGNSARCSFKVTVRDTEPPKIECPADIQTTTDAGQCSARVSVPPAVAADICPGVTVAGKRSDGKALTDPYPVGSTTITWTATDASGNSTACRQLVTVTDGEAPQIHCPANLTQNTDTGKCTAVIAFLVTATDNCGTATVVCSPPSGTAFPRGTTKVTCTATDAGGNQSACSFNVTVADAEPPVCHVPADITQGTDPGQCTAVVTYTATATDNCGTPMVVCTPASGSAFPVGTTTVTCTATDAAGNSATCTFKVTVRDTEPPHIQFPGDIDVPSDPGQCGAVVNFTVPAASDNCPGVTVTFDHPAGSFFPVGTTTVNGTATDRAGNTVKGSFKVTVRIPFSCPADITVITESGQPSATVTLTPPHSDCPGVTVTGERSDGKLLTDPYPVGTTTVTWIATDASGNTARCNQVITVIPPPPGPSGPLLQVTDQVAHPTGLEFFGANPPPPDSDSFTLVRGTAPDGSLLLVDWAGAALIRLPPPPAQRAPGPGESLLDPDRPVPPDGVGIARLLRVEVSRGGAAAIVALRADNTRGIYRLQNGSLTRLGLLDGPRGARELAIGDAGQIAYVAHVDPNDLTSPLALFQSTTGPGIELLRQRQSVVNGATVENFSDLTGNGAGDLALLVDLRFADGSPGQAVLRTRGVVGFEVLAVTGQSVERGGGTGVLTQLRRPRIGPEGSVVFLGAGDGFVNFFVARADRPLAALLPAPGTDLTILDDSARPRFDYEIAADGTIGLEAALANPTDSTLYLISPAGFITPVVGGRRDFAPIQRPVFGPGGLVFFLAENQVLPADRNGRFPVGLYRYRPGTAATEPVAQPGQPIPEWVDAQLLSISQRPVLVGDDLVFGVVFGGPESLGVPTAALFRVPQTGALGEGLSAPEGLVAQEGHPLTDASRLAMLRDLSYGPDGTLIAYGLMPGAGPLIAPGPAPAATAGPFSIDAVALAAAINPLVAQGDNLGPGQLHNVLPPLLSLAPDRELFGARTSPSQTPPRMPDNEGLFTVNLGKKVDQIAGSRREVAGLTGTLYNGFADTKLFILGPPSVAADSRVVFKALLDRSNSALTGIFQWSAGAPPALIRGPEAPTELLRWAAGPSGQAYVLEKPNGGAAQLLGGAAGALKPLITAGSTTVPGVGMLTDLTDMALNSAGDLFVVGTTARGAGVFRLAGGQLTTVALQGAPVTQDRTDDGFGFVFAGSFTLAPDSARGDLIFRAVVQKPGDKARQGEFQFSQGAVVTREIATVDVDSARTLSVDALGSTLPSQSRNGLSVSANLQNGSWSLVRYQLRSNGTLSPPVTIAQDMKGKLANVPRFAALDAGALLAQESDLLLRSGPVFTIDDAGNIAFMASDGKAWGVYSVAGR